MKEKKAVNVNFIIFKLIFMKLWYEFSITDTKLQLGKDNIFIVLKSYSKGFKVNPDIFIKREIKSKTVFYWHFTFFFHTQCQHCINFKNK